MNHILIHLSKWFFGLWSRKSADYNLLFSEGNDANFYFWSNKLGKRQNNVNWILIHLSFFFYFRPISNPDQKRRRCSPKFPWKSKMDQNISRITHQAGMIRQIIDPFTVLEFASRPFSILSVHWTNPTVWQTLQPIG